MEVVDVVLDDVVPDDAELGDGNPTNAEAREPANVCTRRLDIELT